jgi:hypothetical protein
MIRYHEDGTVSYSYLDGKRNRWVYNARDIPRSVFMAYPESIRHRYWLWQFQTGRRLVKQHRVGNLRMRY